jgi:predicted transcriptional regulator
MSHISNAFKDWKEIRRKRAVELQQQGWKQGQIAEALAVSSAAVSLWLSNSAKAESEVWRAKPQ